jgi:ABC-type Zn uptake system ZnuABC Zn-binding protein ZnuA
MSRPLHHLFIALPICLALTGPIPQALAQAPMSTAPIPVVTTLPFLKEFVERIGGPSVSVVNLINGTESVHTYTPKPSDLVAISRARLLVQVGVGLEVWVAPMIQSAKNPRLTIVTAGRGIPLLRESGLDEDDAGGHAHVSGNPHIWLDPENAKMMIRTITDALIKIAPAQRTTFLANQARYLTEIDAAEASIKDQVKRLKDRRIVTHHGAWPYFARRFGFRIEGVILEQPGGEASAQALAGLITLMRQKRITVIAMEPQLNAKVAQTLAEETGATLVTITPLPGALPGTDTYLDMLTYDAQQLIRALNHEPVESSPESSSESSGGSSSELAPESAPGSSTESSSEPAPESSLESSPGPSTSPSQ